MPLGIEIGDDDGRSETGRITLTTIQLAIGQLDAKISAMRTDIQYVREAQMLKFAEYERRFTDQESRIRILEARRVVEASTIWRAAALFVAIGSIIVAIIAVVK